MSRSPVDEWGSEGPGWRPDPADEPAWRSEPEAEAAPAPPEREGPAYLAAAAVVVVSFGLALLTVGLHGGRGAWTRPVLGAGLVVLLLGLGMLALAAWLVGGLEPAAGPSPRGGQRRRPRDDR